jgi:molybdopterin-containing oxidoreductase family iron-sulfur binding subunit
MTFFLPKQPFLYQLTTNLITMAEENKSNLDNKGRRKFLKQSLALGAAAVTGAGFIKGVQAGSHHSEEKVKVLTTDGKLIEVDKSMVMEAPPCKSPAQGDDARMGIPGRKFVMVIDLAKCANARKCITGCQKGHNLAPHQEWITVNLMKDTAYAEPYWFPKPCYHCANPSCVKVCPVGATFKRSDGIVLVDADRCIGCKFCISACPYSARIFNWDHREEYSENDPTYSPETSVPGQVGTVGKCDFCPDLSRNGELPHCVTNCPMGAIYFGDANEDAITNGTETVRLRETIQNKVGYQHMKELGTKPNVYYLPPVDKSFPFERGLENLTDEQKEAYERVLSKIDKQNGTE